jgi:hypothetical protein
MRNGLLLGAHALQALHWPDPANSAVQDLIARCAQWFREILLERFLPHAGQEDPVPPQRKIKPALYVK